MVNLLDLFVAFFKIGGLTFGGGYAMMPLVQKELVENRGIMDQTETYPVKLYIYDLSRGMARQLSPMMLGKFPTCWSASGKLRLRK